jgi:hypothetical protein
MRMGVMFISSPRPIHVLKLHLGGRGRHDCIALYGSLEGSKINKAVPYLRIMLRWPRELCDVEDRTLCRQIGRMAG